MCLKYQEHARARKLVLSSTGLPCYAGRVEQISASLRVTIFGSDHVRERIERVDVAARTAVDAVARTVDLPLNAIASLIGTSTRTINRRPEKDDKLTPSEADRLFRLARVVDLAAEMIGDATSSMRWLHTASRFLGNCTPLEMLRTEIGTPLVEESLYAIAFGGVA